jgi:hypothetical protein
MATVPVSGTNIRLLSGIPFSNDYKNTRWFDNITSQTNYFLSKPTVHSINEANFQRIEGRNFIAVNKSIDELWTTNYLMFQNASYNVKWFYGFVTKLEYVQRNTTYVHFQIDVFQTWKFEMNFKPSFVVREHCKLWNNDGTPVINTVDEGLNYGTEYDTTSILQWTPHDGTFFLVVVAKKTMHGGSTNSGKIVPMLNGSPQPLTYYIHPFKLDGSIPPVTVDGMNINLSTISDVLKGLYTQTDAVNNIVSLYITDYVGYNNILTASSQWVEHATIQDDTNMFNTLYLKSMPYYDRKEHSFGDKWTGYKNVTESKLLMYPYTQLVLDDFKGNRANFKTEYINSSELKVTAKGSIGTSNKVSYGLQDYNFNANGLKPQLADEFALINNEPNDVPIITDLLSAYLQGNRNSIQNQKNSILFNGVMNNFGSFFGGVSSAANRNVLGVANAGTNMIQGTGNTLLQIQGIEAKQQDIANVPPNITKMGSNTAYNFGNEYTGVYVIKKQIKPEYIKKLTDFFNMFGYKVNEVKVPNFHTRQNWNFVQTTTCTITGNFNNEDLQELKSVFDNGITLWHTDDVGNYSLGNEVI